MIVAAAGTGFPNGMAATARITGYARGLNANGSEALVLCLGASEPSSEAAVNTEVRGTARGVRFEYACGSTVRSSSFWQRRRSRLVGLLGAARRIRRERTAGPVEAILLYSQRSLDAALMRFVSRQVGAVYMAEVCEIPYQSPSPGVFEKLRLSVYNRTFYRWFDAAIVISEHLRQHVVRFGNRGMAVLTAPVIVDTDEFQPRPGTGASPRVVVYCGGLDQEKDGVVNLMKAFRSVAAEVHDVHLRVVGDTHAGTRIPELRAVAESLGVPDRVSFTGRVTRDEVPAHLAQASVLVLARPQSLQAEAGMPTKVAEYLASGVPTVLTRTGDMTGFLENGVSAYLVPPDDVPALAEAVSHVRLNGEEATAVGQRGRDVALEHFDYRVVGATLAAFIAELGERTATDLG